MNLVMTDTIPFYLEYVSLSRRSLKRDVCVREREERKGEKRVDFVDRKGIVMVCGKRISGYFFSLLNYIFGKSSFIWKIFWWSLD